jgi:hypothetical protein
MDNEQLGEYLSGFSTHVEAYPIAPEVAAIHLIGEVEE